MERVANRDGNAFGGRLTLRGERGRPRVLWQSQRGCLVAAASVARRSCSGLGAPAAAANLDWPPHSRLL